jgi:hypothetical protein
MTRTTLEIRVWLDRYVAFAKGFGGANRPPESLRHRRESLPDTGEPNFLPAKRPVVNLGRGCIQPPRKHSNHLDRRAFLTGAGLFCR